MAPLFIRHDARWAGVRTFFFWFSPSSGAAGGLEVDIDQVYCPRSTVAGYAGTVAAAEWPAEAGAAAVVVAGDAWQRDTTRYNEIQRDTPRDTHTKKNQMEKKKVEKIDFWVILGFS